MKKCFNPLFITLLLLGILVISPTNVWAQTPEKVGCSSADGKTSHKCGDSWTDNYNGVVYDCKCNCPSQGSDCIPRSQSGGNSSYSGSNQSAEMQLMQPLIESFFDALFRKADNSQRNPSFEETQKQLAEAQHNKEAMEQWQKFQVEEMAKNQMQKTTQGEELLKQMETVGNGDELQPFSMGNPKLDMQPLSQNAYPTSNYTEWERLLCSAYFSDLAKKSANDVDARFYADQAERVMSGEPTFIECRMPKVSDEKVKRMEEVKILYNEMNVKFNELQDIEYKLKAAGSTVLKTDSIKVKAAEKLSKIQNEAPMARAEEKSHVDSLLIQAQRELREAESQLELAKNSERDLLNRKTGSETEFNNLKTQIQGKIQSEEEK
jgi:hypothetical protein